MHNLTETGVFGAAVPVPDDGVDYRTAASLYAALQELTNRTRALSDFLGSLTGSITLPANLSITGSTNSHGLLTASAGFHCTAAPATFDWPVTCTGLLTANGGIAATTINCTSRIQTSEILQGVGLAISGTSSQQNIDAAVIGCTALNTPTLSCAAAGTFGNTCVFNGPVTLNSTLTCQGIGRVIRTGRLGVTSGATTLDPAVATTWMFGSTSNVMTADIDATLTGGDNEEIEVTLRGASGHVLNVRDPSSAILLVLTASATSGTYWYVKLKRFVGTWQILNASTHP